MIATLLTGFAASPWARTALRYGTIAIAIVLFLLLIRRAGERTGRCQQQSKREPKGSAKCCHFGVSKIAAPTCASIRATALVT